ncbi:hypothetical protein [Falsirhodobacter sp. 20TX0035]|uniref:hypothetical protein n=1 Tax=Falsirhodobacter sp. 20TX0035 TaxID=3022019 RepID=UPI00232DA4A3|nr:hypothetical protein [Falsirhodobacter sp. 20TX0035]MDB6452050.1 hypothetical protein [Falsirhodobacter sp. 20TX0035]
MDTERMIELEREVVATRRAAVDILHDLVLAGPGLDPARVAEDLERRADTAAGPEARLARLLAETLRRL